MKQRDKMRELLARYGYDEERICQEYARAEDRGEVSRESNKNNLTGQEYARRLFHDGTKKSWISK